MTLLENGHLSGDAIENYSMARLDQALMEEFEEHLLLCASCQDRLRETDQFVHAFRVAAARAESEDAAVVRPDPEPASANLWGWFTGRPLYAMGGALAAAALVVMLVPRGSQEPATGTAIELHAIRGGAAPVVSAAARLNLTLGLIGLPAADPLRVAVARESGEERWSATIPRPEGEKLTVKPDVSLSPGLYWIRIYGPDNTLLREYGLELKK